MPELTVCINDVTRPSPIQNPSMGLGETGWFVLYWEDGKTERGRFPTRQKALAFADRVRQRLARKP